MILYYNITKKRECKFFRVKLPANAEKRKWSAKSGEHSRTVSGGEHRLMPLAIGLYDSGLPKKRQFPAKYYWDRGDFASDEKYH